MNKCTVTYFYESQIQIYFTSDLVDLSTWSQLIKIFIMRLQTECKMKTHSGQPKGKSGIFFPLQTNVCFDHLPKAFVVMSFLIALFIF